MNLIYTDTWPLLHMRRRLLSFLARIQFCFYLIVTSKPFEYLSLFAITINTIFMIVSDPTSDTSISNRSEIPFFVIYATELIFKLIGMGFFTKNIGYLRSPWNVLDFVIVAGSCLNIVLKNLNLNLSALRTLRVLRPLRTISSVKSLKNIILTIFSSLPFLKDIYIILFFFLILFGITGMHLFQGVLQNQCFDPVTSMYTINNFIVNSGYCDNDNSCPDNSLCISTYSNPFFGQTGFDNIFMSISMAFQIFTGENWSTLMYYLMSAFTSIIAVVTVIYFIAIIILLNLIVGNLMLAVIVVKFNETQKMIDKEKEKVHRSEFCNCKAGFNYAQMKLCGYFLNLSNLKQNDKKNMKYKRFNYVEVASMLKPIGDIEVDTDFRFFVVEVKYLADKNNNKSEIMAKVTKNSLNANRNSTMRKNTMNANGISSNSVRRNRKNTNVNWKDTADDQFDFSLNDRNKKLINQMVEANKSLDSSISYSFDRHSIDVPKLPTHMQNQQMDKQNIERNERIADIWKYKPETQLAPKRDFDEDFKSITMNNHNLPSSKSRNNSRNFVLENFKVPGKGNHLTLDSKYKNNNMSQRISISQLVISKEEVLFDAETMKKERKKTETELTNFVNSNHNHLKLDIDYCKNDFDKNYEEVQNSVLPSQQYTKLLLEQQKKKTEVLKRRIEMYYNVKYLYYEKELLNEATETESKSGNQTSLVGSYVENNLKFEESDKVEDKRESGEVRIEKRVKKRFEIDLESSNMSYLYVLKKKSLIVPERGQKSNMDLKLRNGLKVSNDKVIKPTSFKHKSKDFSLISSFFKTEFELSYEPKVLVSVNQMYYNAYINDCIKKLKVIHTNWSGSDVYENTKNQYNKGKIIFSSLNDEVHVIWLSGLMGQFNIFRLKIRQLFGLLAVESFFIAMVLLNTVVLSLNGFVTDVSALDKINYVLTIIFTVEIGLKIIGLGPPAFYKDVFNIFDALVVTISITEIILGQDSQQLSVLKVIRVLRIIRVLRVARILRQLKFMRTLIKIFEITFEQFLYITLLLLLFLSIFSLIGMQLYAGKFVFYGPGEIMAQNFETFTDAFIVMVDVMSIVNWNDTAVLLARTDLNFLISFIFLVSWIFIGNFILLNLFIAVLLDGFRSALVINQIEDINNEVEGIKLAVMAELDDRNRTKNNAQKVNDQIMSKSKLRDIDVDIDRQKDLIKEEIIYRFDKKDQAKEEDEEENIDVRLDKIIKMNENQSISSGEHDLKNFIFKENAKTNEEQELCDSVVCEESLFLFPKKSAIRMFFIKLVSDPKFETFIIIVIFINSIQLIISTWSDSSWNDTPMQMWMSIVEYIVNGVFIIECISKVIAFGFFICPNSYLRDSWSRLDFFIVCSSVLDMFINGSSSQILGIVKIIRTFRPLRILSHNPNLKIVIQCLLQSFTGIINVAVVMIIIWLMFAILGMNLLEGKLGFCNFADNRSYFYINSTMCPDVGGVWQIRGCNFENIINAMSAVYVFSSAENWNTYTYYMMNGDEASLGPSYKASWLICYFSLLIVFTSTFFLTKLFIGVIYSEFASEHERINKENFRIVSDDQIKWIQMQKMIRAATPNYVEIIIPTNRFRLFVYRIVNSKTFEWFILSMICLNMLVLSMVYYDMNPLYGQLLDYLSYVFTIVFILEAILKIFCSGFLNYFSVSWNKFDFLIVMVSIMDVVLTNFVSIQNISIYPLIGRLMRIMRVIRIFKIMKSRKLEGIKKIVKTLYYSFPAILNVSLVLILVYFIFSVLGVFLFKDHDPAFNNFASAFLFLFKMCTGEAWPDFMYNDDNYNYITSTIYWHSFLFFTTFTLMNLFTSVIIDQFSNFYFDSDNPVNSFEEIVEEFRVCWLHFTKAEKGERIKNKDVLNFFICLKSPLGFHIPIRNEKASVYGSNFSVNYFLGTLKFDINYVRRKISEMKLLEDKQNYISFGQVLHSSLKNAFGKNCYQKTNSETYKQMKNIELKTITKIFNKKIDNYEVAYNGKNEKIIKARITNPFNNAMFSQMIFQIWYNHVKCIMGLDEVSSDNFEELMNKNPERQFNNQIINKSKK